MTWKITDNRVHGNGQNYTLPNHITAQQLHKTLTTYEKIAKQSAETDKKLDNIQRTIISLQMSISIIGDELERLHKEIL